MLVIFQVKLSYDCGMVHISDPNTLKYNVEMSIDYQMLNSYQKYIEPMNIFLENEDIKYISEQIINFYRG